jgi:hypothetical protein
MINNVKKNKKFKDFTYDLRRWKYVTVKRKLNEMNCIGRLLTPLKIVLPTLDISINRKLNNFW